MAEYDYITQTGLIVVDTADLKSQVQAEWLAAFGSDLVLADNTPEGVLITAETLARDAAMRNNAAVANQINPNLAGGVFLDAIWALTGGGRFRATPSLIPGVEIHGTPGALVNAGAQASVGPTGAIFASVGDVAFDATGTAVIAFQSVDLGPVAAPVGALDTIVSGVLGWETVTNPAAAVLGISDESDVASRSRRRNTLALQGSSLTEAVQSAVNDVPGITSVCVRENYTNAALVVDGVNLVANSLFVCADGGADVDIATAMLSRKSIGCNWNGATVVDVVEPVTGQTYPVAFQRPTYVPIFMTVTVKSGAAVASPEQAVRDAILAYAAGEVTGEDGFKIGGDVSAFELAGAINAQSPSLFVTNLLVGATAMDITHLSVAIDIEHRATVIAGNIAVNVV